MIDYKKLSEEYKADYEESVKAAAVILEDNEKLKAFIRRAHALTCEWTLSDDGGENYVDEGLNWVLEVEAVDGLILSKPEPEIGSHIEPDEV